MKSKKEYDAVKEARKIREQLSLEYFKDPEAFKKRVREAGERYEQELKNRALNKTDNK